MHADLVHVCTFSVLSGACMDVPGDRNKTPVGNIGGCIVADAVRRPLISMFLRSKLQGTVGATFKRSARGRTHLEPKPMLHIERGCRPSHHRTGQSRSTTAARSAQSSGTTYAVLIAYILRSSRASVQSGEWAPSHPSCGIS